MNEVPTALASHPSLWDNPGLALQETFEHIDQALGEAAQENEHVYRYMFVALMSTIDTG